MIVPRSLRKTLAHYLVFAPDLDYRSLIRRKILPEQLKQVLALSGADLFISLAGEDPYIGDRLGRLAVSMTGLAPRDRFVMEFCHSKGLPVVLPMTGG